jgi:hypothetical protein
MSSVTITASYVDNLLDVCITARKTVATARAPVHFALLVDVSGSMEGHRLEEVRRTIHRLIDLMDPDDSISIISYHSEAAIVLNTMKLGADRTSHHTATDTLRAKGGTNLEAGLQAIPTLSSPPSAVFLLTDGHVNEGINLTSALMSLARLILPADTPLHTLGYGAEHNQALLRDIGFRTHGSYFYADGDEIIPIALGTILGAMTAEVGRDTRLIVPAGYTCLEMSYTMGDPHVGIGRLIDEKPHHVVFQKNDASVAIPAEILFHWNDGADHVERVVPTAPASALDVHEQMFRATAAKTLSEVSDYLIRRDTASAETRLRELKAALDASPVATRLLIIQLRAQVDGMLADLHPATGPPPAYMLSRMASSGASAAAYAGNQAGALSGDSLRAPSVFVTPRQTQTIRTLSLLPSEDPAV